jgi:hypothetical protein
VQIDTGNFPKYNRELVFYVFVMGFPFAAVKLNWHGEAINQHSLFEGAVMAEPITLEIFSDYV